MTVTVPSHAAPRGPRGVYIVFALWIAAALLFAATGVLSRLPRPMIPALIWTPVIASVIAWHRSEGLRAFARALDLRVPILYHLVRVAFGALFLIEMRAGRMPASFALLAGPGDIVAGLLALPAAALALREGDTARRLALGWNVLGLVDILAVFVTAQRALFSGDDSLFIAFQRLPYPLLPVLVVPLILMTHILVFARLRARP